MDIQSIRDYIMSCSYYSGQVGPYIIPRYTDTKVDIINNMIQELNRPDSSYVRGFKKDISKYLNFANESQRVLLNYIEEFPVVIDNRDLWNHILDCHNIPKDSEFRSRRYFLLDFLFYESGFVVEIDSEYHDNKNRKIYDSARDRYVRVRYKLNTLILCDIVITMKDIINIYPNEFGIFTSLELQKLFLNNVSDLFRKIYGNHLYIQDTTEFSLHEVLFILDIRKREDYWNILVDNSIKITPWIRKLLGKLPKEEKLSTIIEDSGDSPIFDITEFMNILRKIVVSETL